jgi:hypothetical protein
MSDPVGQYLDRYRARRDDDTADPVESYRRRYLTAGTDEEARFRSWYGEHAKRLGLDADPDSPLHYYDYRAAFHAGAAPDASGHWPSEFKREGHPNLIVDGRDTRTGRPVEPEGWLGRVGAAARKTAEIGAGIVSGEYARRAGAAIGRDVAREPLDVPRQVGRGLAESGYATGIGVAELLEAAAEQPYRPTGTPQIDAATGVARLVGRWLKGVRASEVLRGSREEAREFYGAPKTTTGTVAGVGARIVGDVAQYASPAVALQAVKVAAPATLLGRIGLQVATGAPITAAIAAAGPEESTVGGIAELTGSERLRRVAASPAQRVAFDVLVDAVLAGAGEAVAALLKRTRAVREAAVAAGKPDVAATVDELGNEAAQLSILKERTPKQTARLRELSAQLQASEAEIGPLRSLEESAAAPGVQEARASEATQRILERERAAEVPVDRVERPAAVEEPAAVRAGFEIEAPPSPPGEAVAPAADDVWDMLFPSSARAGFVDPNLLAAIARGGGGGVVGGAAGAQVGDTPAERRRNALLGALAGAGLGVAARRLVRGGRGVVEGAEGAARAGRAAAKPADINVRDYFNISRLQLPPQLEQQVEQFIRTQYAPNIRGIPKIIEKWDTVKKQAARVLATEPQTLNALNPEKMTRVEGLAALSLARTKWLEMDDVLRRVSTAVDEGERVSLEASAALLQHEAEQLLESVAQGATAAGRNLNALKISATVKADPSFWFVKAKRLLGDRPFTPEIRDRITELVNGRDITGLRRYLAGLERASIPQQLVTLYRAGLLTRLAGRLRDFTSNLGHLVLDRGVVTYPRAVADWLLGNLVTGQRTATAPTVRRIVATGGGAVRGLREAGRLLGINAAWTAPKGARFQAWLDAVRTAEIPQHLLDRYDIPRSTTIDFASLSRDPEAKLNVALDVYQKLVFRFSGAADAIVRTAAYHDIVEDLARAQALTERAPDVAKRVRELVAAPPLELTADALSLAETITFQNRGLASQMAGAVVGTPGRVTKTALRRVTTPGVAESVGETIDAAVRTQLPFVRTASNIAARVSEYTPLGAPRAAYHTWLTVAKRLRETPEGARILRYHQRAAADLLAKLVIGGAPSGVGLLWLGAHLYESDLATGATPANPTERETRRMLGRAPNSIHGSLVGAGDMWTPLSTLGPGGMVVAVGATLADLSRQAQEHGREAGAAELAGAVGRSVLDQPLLTGSRTLLEALADPARYGERKLQSTAAGVVPSGVRAVAEALDQPGVQRETRTLGAAVASGIPGVRETLPVRRGPLGEPVPARTGAVNALLNPFAGPRDVTRDDPLLREIARVGVAIPPLTRQPNESPDEYERRNIEYGQRTRARLESVMFNVRYVQASVERQREMLEDVVTDTRRDLSRRRRRAPAGIVRP